MRRSLAEAAPRNKGVSIVPAWRQPDFRPNPGKRKEGSQEESDHTFPFHHMNIAIARKLGELLDVLAGGGPMNFQLIDLSGGANSQHFSRIVRGKIAASIILEPLPRLAACFP